MPGDLPDWQTNVNISGQSVTINESITGQTVAVYSGSQYAPVQGNGKYISAVTATQGSLALSTATMFIVPTGKTFWCQGYGLAFTFQSAAGTPYFVFGAIGTPGVTLSIAGGVAGFATVLDSPVPFTSGQSVQFSYEWGVTAANWQGQITMWGWQQ